jgi:hypothetical protein
MAKWKLPAALAAAAVAVLGAAVAGGTAATAQAQTTAAAAASTGPHPAAASTAAGGTWSPAIPVPGLATITGLTCTSPGNCVAVGQGTAGGAQVATERNGVWHAAQRFTLAAKTAATIRVVNAVACSSQGNCVAGGNAYNPKDSNPLVSPAWVVAEKNGTWGKAELISASTINAIACVPDGGCTAVGSRYPDPHETAETGMVVAESGGTWGKSRVVPAPVAGTWPYLYLDWISCTAGGDCAAGGSLYNGGNDGWQESISVLVTETKGVWGAATLVPGLPSASSGQVMNNYIEGLACQSPGDCTAAGTYDVTDWSPGTTVASGSFLITETGGTWQPTVLVAASDGGYYVSSLSCLSSRNCVIAGKNASNGYPIAADVVNGNVTGTPAVLPGSAGLHIDGSTALVSCVHTGYCAIAGSTFVAIKTAAGWQPVQPVRGIPQRPGGVQYSSINAISCTAPGYCSAAGSYGYSNSPGTTQAFAVDEATTSATRLKISTPKITYGHEQTEHLIIDVTSHYTTALTGTVTIKAGSTTLAVLTLKSGNARYTLTAKQLKAASYALTATYSGKSAYLASTSAAVKVKVVK